MPALFTRTSTRPKLLTARLMSASTTTRFVTSTANPAALPPGGQNLVYDCVYPVLTPRSQDDLRSLSRKKLRSALSKSAAGSGDDYGLVCNI
jgi:hypothetical protein